MKQKQYSPFSVAQMGVSLFTVDKGYLDDVPVSEIGAFDAALQAYMHQTYSGLMDLINSSGGYDAEIEVQLTSAIEEFKRTGAW